jgi:hypothetical protein
MQILLDEDLKMVLLPYIELYLRQHEQLQSHWAIRPYFKVGQSLQDKLHLNAIPLYCDGLGNMERFAVSKIDEELEDACQQKWITALSNHPISFYQKK